MNQNGVNDVPLLTDQECALQVGQRLCLARQSLGLTTQVLAKLLGTSGAKITEVEQGKLFLPVPWGNKLYYSLGIDLIWLLTGEQEIRMKKPQYYNDVVYHMRVPEVNQNINIELSRVKTIFNEQIREYERVHEVSLNGGLQ